MKLGIVGLPNVGKSTLFNAITKAGAESANYPFCTIEPNVGVVSVPDKRLDVLRDLYNSKKIVPTAIEFYDKIGEDSYYNRIVVDRYPWSKAMLLYPVPYNEMQKSKLTVQNPLWN